MVQENEKVRIHMKKDMQSYREHDADYKTVFNAENSKKVIANYDRQNIFSLNGFEDAVKVASKSIHMHIDIGCGSGWLLLKTAPFFKRVIGIDPSENGIEVAKELTKDVSNIEFVAKDMTDGVMSLNIKEPAFITTAVVLSHIQDFHVKDFLSVLNTLPTNSILFFNEPYDANVQQNMWHVRSKQWWSEQLSEWDLKFKNLPGKYPHGIFGKKVGNEHRINRYKMSPLEKIQWVAQGLSNKVQRVFRAAKRMLVKGRRKW